MTNKERVKLAINHKEPDRVPIDIGSALACDIAMKAYKNLINYLGIEIKDIHFADITAQTARMDEAVFSKLGIDFRPIRLSALPKKAINLNEEDDYYWFQDEWGIRWKMPKVDGFYFDMVSFPLADSNIDNYKWPNPSDPARFEGLEELCSYYENIDAAMVFPERMGNGFLQMGSYLFGYDRWFLKLAADPLTVEKYLEKYLELKISFWGAVLDRIGNKIDIVCELDDLGTQVSQFISIPMYRKYIKPRLAKLISFIKQKADVKFYYHSCGSMFNFIPELIDVGVDIINPLQYSAKNMNLEQIKKEFGNDLVLWGGGIDTQRILPLGSKQEIKDEVKKNLEILAPGGGYVFATVHNIQADVPPENIVAMLEAFQLYGTY